MIGQVKILVADKITEEALSILRSQKKLLVEYLPEISDAELIEKLKDTHGLVIRTRTQVTRDLLKHTNSLKLVCRVGIGLDNIDLKACGEKAIRVYNTPVGNRVSTAEHSFGLLLALARKIPQASSLLKSGNWNREQLTGTEISEKTLGIIGLGNIGREVAWRAQAFGMKVIAYDPYLQWMKAMKIRVRLHPLDMVLKNSDFVSMHVPLTDETRSMVNSEFLKRMKPGSFFINCSRGAVVDEAAMVQAVESGHIRGAALDVFAEEPLKNPERFKSDKFILTPHMAGQTTEALQKISLEATQVIIKFFV